jgi:hypothetical protein
MKATEEKVAAFLEYMAKRMKERGGSLSEKHRVAFIALRPAIERGRTQGYTMKAIWAGLRDEGKLSMRYETFCAHCRRASIAARSGATNLPEAAHRGFLGGRGPRRGDVN